MKKSFVSLSLATALVVSSVPAFSNTASAESLDNLKEERSTIENQREEISGEISTTNSRIEEIVAEQETVTAQIKELDAKIASTTEQINQVSAEIDETNAQIAQLQTEIEELKKKIEERDALLQERARAIQISGGSVSYVDVLLGAESFGDFIDRFTAVNTLVDADRKIMEEQRKDKETLEQKEAEVQQQLADLEAQKADLDNLKADLDGQKADKNDLMESLEAKQAELEEEKSKLEEKDSELKELAADVENRIVAEQERLAELARQRELERQAELEAQRKAEAERQAAAASQTSGGGSSQTSQPPAQTAPVTGDWVRPASGRTTSEFGYDILNGQPRYHYGIDVAAPTGTPIVAAAGGYVIEASTGHNGGYGNMIMIAHNINGQQFTTVYAHLSSIAVSNNQYVEPGQYIGGMGNTGFSFGSHLHFEIHEGGWNGAKSNAVNPRKYIGF
ncbi:murein hydrolase activator EnvC family protein [Jeotgalibacillus aurantiacus]|uniref:murein hydrolase activator EnvC family protein n=1 Tax=Jeotgalibacillus aurantiacus TaxID=2763266 RepID=UPI001D0A3022|nr:peptidoglycan DD-metalloendopeptidase family protein [Jeotgalibacillus aurantiacus]